MMRADFVATLRPLGRPSVIAYVFACTTCHARLPIESAQQFRPLKPNERPEARCHFHAGLPLPEGSTPC